MAATPDIPNAPLRDARVAFWIKWVASLFQIVGYGAIALG